MRHPRYGSLSMNIEMVSSAPRSLLRHSVSFNLQSPCEFRLRFIPLRMLLDVK